MLDTLDRRGHHPTRCYLHALSVLYSALPSKGPPYHTVFTFIRDSASVAFGKKRANLEAKNRRRSVRYKMDGRDGWMDGCLSEIYPHSLLAKASCKILLYYLLGVVVVLLLFRCGEYHNSIQHAQPDFTTASKLVLSLSLSTSTQ